MDVPAVGDYLEREPIRDLAGEELWFPSQAAAVAGMQRPTCSGKPAMSNFPDYAGPLVETMLLGNLAVWAANEAGQVGKKIEWDAKELKATNAPEADAQPQEDPA